MAKQKQKPGPKAKSPKKLRSVSLEIELLEAAERMSMSNPFRPTVPTIINMALRKFLESEGHLQPRQENPSA